MATRARPRPPVSPAPVLDPVEPDQGGMGPVEPDPVGLPYRVLAPLRHNGVNYAPGDRVLLDAGPAAGLLAGQVIACVEVY